MLGDRFICFNIFIFGRLSMCKLLIDIFILMVLYKMEGCEGNVRGSKLLRLWEVLYLYLGFLGGSF